MSENHPLPEPNRLPENLDERDVAFLECPGYSVKEWTPERDGKGQPEAILLEFETGIEIPDRGPLVLAARLKSAKEVNRLIQMLERHRNNVWPGG